MLLSVFFSSLLFSFSFASPPVCARTYAHDFLCFFFLHCKINAYTNLSSFSSRIYIWIEFALLKIAERRARRERRERERERARREEKAGGGLRINHNRLQASTSFFFSLFFSSFFFSSLEPLNKSFTLIFILVYSLDFFSLSLALFAYSVSIRLGIKA